MPGIRSKSPEEPREIRVAVEKILRQGVEGDGLRRFYPKGGNDNTELFKMLT
jgi:hypothetical protein